MLKNGEESGILSKNAKPNKEKKKIKGKAIYHKLKGLKPLT